MKKRIISAILLVFVAVVALIPTLSFNAEAASTEITFNLGANGNASHYDGSSKTSYSETVSGYTLSITGGTNMYTGARDAKGNSCIKLGTGSKAGSFSFTVPSDVTSVNIYIAKYKTNAASIKVNNGTATALTKNSNDGNYDVITVDTTSTKSVSLSVSSGYRAMVNTIEFVIAAQCDHTNTSIVDAKDATCTETGYTGDTVCSCGETIKTGTTIPVKEHNYVDGSCEECGQADPDACAHTNTTTVDTATCTNDGEKTTTCDDCGEVQSVVTSPAKGHIPGAEADCTNNQICTVCNNVITKALGHDCDDNGACSRCDYQAPLASFVVPNGATAVDGKFGPTFTAPAAPALADVNYSHDYTFVGWATSTQEDGTTAPTVYAAGATVTISEDTTYYAVYSYVVESTSKDYVKKDLSEITSTDVVVITMSTANGVYAIANNKGTGASPTAIAVTVSGNALTGTIESTILWNISNNNGEFVIYVNGDNTSWLYTTNSNSGVRVGNNNQKTFRIENVGGNDYLYHIGQGRYFGVYNQSDWRGYTPVPTSSSTSNIKNQSLEFYVLSGDVTYYTTNLVVASCEHENTIDTVENATCTSAGSITTNCADCGEMLNFEIINATGHNYKGEITVNASCTENGTYTYTCANCYDSYNEAIKATGHNYVDKMCSKCGIEQPFNVEINTTIKDYASENGWTNEIQYTDMILGECLTATVTGKTNSGKYYSNNQEWRLYQTENATITFTTNSGYIISSIKITYTYSNSGILYMGDTQVKSGTVVSVNSDTVTFNVGNTGDANNGQVKITAIEVTYQLPAEFSGASLNVGSDLSIRYHALLGSNAADYIVRFTMNGKVTEVKGVLEDGKYVFSFCGITPQCMGDIVKAELILNDEVIDTVEEFSVKSYVVKAFENHADNAILLQFLSDMLYYGAEAQKYTGYKTDALVTDGIELLAASTNAPAADYDHKSIVTEDGHDKSLAKFTAAGVNFDYNNKIFVKFTTSDIENVEICINGASLEIKALGDGKYIAYSYAISALEFENAVDFELYYDGELAQTLTYTVIDYVAAMQNDSEIGALVNALYNYGVSAKNYDSNK